MNTKVTQILFNILAQFKSGDIPKAVAYSMYPIPGLPSAHWSLINRTIMFCLGTMDARGYRQWQQIGRNVKAGTKCFHILVPYIKTVEDEERRERTAC